MHTKASIHMHPKVTNPLRVFEVRHLAKVAGCTFIAVKGRHYLLLADPPINPNDGGHAA